MSSSPGICTSKQICSNTAVRSGITKMIRARRESAVRPNEQRCTRLRVRDAPWRVIRNHVLLVSDIHTSRCSLALSAVRWDTHWRT
jgi:hypothetical protein